MKKPITKLINNLRKEGLNKEANYINDILLNKLAIGSPTNALINPMRFGLVPVEIFFGVPRERPDKKVLITGDTVIDKNGDIFFVVGTGADGNPLLAENEEELEIKKNKLDQSRLHHETPESTVRRDPEQDSSLERDSLSYIEALELVAPLAKIIVIGHGLAYEDEHEAIGRVADVLVEYQDAARAILRELE
jgi:hypothetical protein